MGWRVAGFAVGRFSGVCLAFGFFLMPFMRVLGNHRPHDGLGIGRVALRPCELTGLILLAGQPRGHYIFLLWPERSIKTELFDAELLWFEGHLALANDASASVGQSSRNM